MKNSHTKWTEGDAANQTENVDNITTWATLGDKWDECDYIVNNHAANVSTCVPHNIVSIYI